MNSLEEITEQIVALQAQAAALIEQKRQLKRDAVKEKHLAFGIVQPAQASYWELDYSDLDTLFAQEFGIETECLAEEEWRNDSLHSYTTSQDCYTEYDKEDVAKWLAGATDVDAWPGVGNLLSELVLRGRLPAGDYLIRVCW